MSDKKNIDRLFQEKFKDFEVSPNDEVWKKIQARKNKDRKRVIFIPFWYRIAGVAAILAVILSVGSVFVTDDSTKETIVSTEEELNDIKPLSSEKQNLDSKNSDDALVNTSDNNEFDFNDETSESNKTNNQAITENSLTNDNKEEESSKKSEGKNTFTTNSFKNPPVNKNNTEGITNINETKKEIDNINDDYLRKDQTISKQKVTNTGSITDIQKTNTSQKNTEEKLSEFKKTNIENTIADNAISSGNKKQQVTDNKDNTNFKDSEDFIKNTEESIANNTEINKNRETEKTVSDEVIDQDLDNGKKSIFDAIKEKEAAVAKAESKTIKRWNIAPNIAPVYYDSFGGSSIDSQFSDNNKQGEVNLSYGIQVAYAINEKLILRSGVSKVDVGYNTEDVGFGIASLGRENGLSNTQSIVVSDYQNGSVSLAPPPGDVNSEILVKSQNPGLLNHSIGYIEVPLELKYALTNSKVGIHMIGGVSTLFLEDDEVSIIAGSFRNENVSREQTVNDISFSGNIGIGFDYKLSDKFKINMEPIFKYQFNGFKDSADNFKPYYFGIYTGVSFRF
ncbi:hypothetical protein J8L88_00280 [Aquimarina sp. MMG015]|uniref:hypothetical protein n=1 Tax=Aquimarina sp. MMG015 TaxID=2822689 RepID=UPI001B3A48DB|nr:hypothetical protein [Aquimarina sp. MMG015]MBQ4801265.1 hypothetical protein [Aquimarina sp. MMG015]